MKTRLFTLTIIAVLLIGILAACGGVESEVTVPGKEVNEVATPHKELSVVTLVEDYDDALTIKNQLLLGTLSLEGTGQAIATDQASELLVLWQAFSALSASGTAAPEEIEAVQNQNMELMTSGQVGAITSMRLTNISLQEFFVEAGLTEVKTPDPDATPESTRMRYLPKEDREATRIASGEEPTGSGGAQGYPDPNSGYTGLNIFGVNLYGDYTANVKAIICN